jgi:hypothetical protein
MKMPVKIGLVAAGYVAAALVALAAVDVYVVYSSGPGQHASAGMFAFGDSLVFLAVFAVAAIPAAGATLYFFRPYQWFWIALAAGAICIAVTALAAMAEFIASRGAPSGSVLHAWTPLAVLRIFIAPLFALASFVSALMTPNRGPRVALLAAVAVEAAVFVTITLVWFQPVARGH